MIKPKRLIVDTTLRDGEQSPGIVFSEKEKLEYALMMDKCGIFQIEAGIPAIGTVEKEAIYKIMQNKKNTKISVWNRMLISDIEHSIDCRPDIIHISAPVSYVQIYAKLRKNKQWLLNTLFQCVSFAMSKGFKVTVGFEDASRADITFLISLAESLHEMGVEYIRFADTVGVLTPDRAGESVKAIVDSGIDVEIHVHNDLGMAVANSLVAVKQGAKYVDCTFGGIGERAGNCDLLHFLHIAETVFDFGIDKSIAKQIDNTIRERLYLNPVFTT